MQTTTIAVSEEVHEQLKKFGAMGDSFDTVLRRLLAKAGAPKP
jgi:predicted CopG family antitoxin